MALLFRSTVDSAARWQEVLGRLRPGLEFRAWPEIGDPAEIEYALVWRAPPGFLASLPKLRLILSLGAGVDHLLLDPDLPRQVPFVRLIDPYLSDAMAEYVALQVLRLHRQDFDYRAQQRHGCGASSTKRTPPSARSASSALARSARPRRRSSPPSASPSPAGPADRARSMAFAPMPAATASPSCWRRPKSSSASYR